MGRIVVGIDGSRESRQALEWAIEEARIRGDEVQAIHAWQYPLTTGSVEGVVAPALHVDFKAEARALADKVVTEVVGDGEAPVPVIVETPQKPASIALIAASTGARMVVLGSRGRGGFAGFVLGSVGQECVKHAHCPVVIIPHEQRKVS